MYKHVNCIVALSNTTFTTYIYNNTTRTLCIQKQRKCKVRVDDYLHNKHIF